MSPVFLTRRTLFRSPEPSRRLAGSTCQREVSTFGLDVARDWPRGSGTIGHASQPDFGVSAGQDVFLREPPKFDERWSQSVPTEKVRGSNPLSSTNLLVRGHARILDSGAVGAP